ncbi:hypothetical protein ParKJ_00375 [Paraburkholderia fungorum]|jgi:hypothetical protein|uniref:Uncharacterized protein n=1 Tax=Paraburkholderia fungorum TaxID=134537 RepID=A0AAP5Q2E7_9BURK|nr:hypothetical protein [Paraburkholderia fungorum]MDT8835863.1 hypothetical protein [Paraburkholderia fungorum]
MDIAKTAGTGHQSGSGIRLHVRMLLVTLGIMGTAAAGLALALWLASFFFVASQHLNPLHAGFHAWPDAALAWHDGHLPKQGRRLAGAALFGVVLAFGAPALGVYTLLEQSGRRRLYGSARFANEADIRRAGLL